MGLRRITFLLPGEFESGNTKQETTCSLKFCGKCLAIFIIWNDCSSLHCHMGK